MALYMRGDCSYCERVNVDVICPIVSTDMVPIFTGMACSRCIVRDAVRIDVNHPHYRLVRRLARRMDRVDRDDSMAVVIDMAAARKRMRRK